MKKIYILVAVLVVSGIGIYQLTKSANQKNNSTETTNSQESAKTNSDDKTEETDDDEDYTKVVIDPVDNITENQEAQLVTTADQLMSCGYTRQTTEGPYFVTGTRQLTNGNLNYDNLPGTPLVISGYVYGGTDNSTPLSGAKVEIWQADDSGSYHPNANGPASNYSEEELSLRGHVVTDSEGYYSFTTIYPGEYRGRARHIHVSATVDGYEPIISQIILSLPGDEMSSTEDMIARALDSSCSAPSITNVDGTDKGFYSFWLEKN